MRSDRARARTPVGVLTLACALAGCQTYEASPLDAQSHRRAWRDRTPTAPEVLDAAVRLSDGAAHAPFALDDGLSLHEAEAVALAFNPDLRLARARAAVSAAIEENAGLVPDPVLFGDIGHVIDDVDDPFMGAAVLGFTIPISGRLEAERELAGADREADILRVYAAEWSTRVELWIAWTEWSIATRRLAVLDHFLSELSSLVQTVDAIEAAGEIAPVNARLFSLERATRAAQHAGAKGDIERFRARVYRLLGLDQRRPIDLTPSVVLRPDEVESDEDAWPSIDHPDALLARAEHEGAERALALEVTKQYPDIVLGPGLGREDGTDRVMLGFSIPIPIFNRNRQAIGVARAERDAARVAYEATLERLDADLAEARIQLTASRSEREMLENEVAPIADRQHDEALRIAELGEVDTLLLLESLKRRFDARLAALEALRAESIASIRIQAAIGPRNRGAVSEEHRP